MTVSLNSALLRNDRIISALLGALVALMSMQLMARHRSISLSDERALMRLEERLGISSPFEGVEATGGLWGVKISSYKLWQTGLLMFTLVNLGLFASLVILAKI